MRPARCVSLFATAFAVVFAIAASGPAAQAQSALSGGAAAVVNDEVITQYDLEQRARLVALTSGIQPTAENTPQILQQALRALIDERLQLQELRRMEKDQKFEIVAKDDEVDEQINDMARENRMTPEQFRARMAAAGLEITTMREQIRAQISWQRMIQGRYGSRIKISKAQVDQAAERLRANAAQQQFLVSEVFIDAARAGGIDEAVTGAGQLVAQIQQGAPIAAVARQFSSALTAANGGDMGWVTASELQPEVAAVVSQMPPRTVSQPIPVRDGVYIVSLRDRRGGGSVTLVGLKQAAVALMPDAPAETVAAAQSRLEAFRAQNPTCATVESLAAADTNLVSGDLGETDVQALPPEFRDAVSALQPGQLSNPVRTQAGMHLLFVCSRRTDDAAVPPPAQLERRLMSEQLAMLSRRSLRDLRSSATIQQP